MRIDCNWESPYSIWTLSIARCFWQQALSLSLSLLHDQGSITKTSTHDWCRCESPLLQQGCSLLQCVAGVGVRALYCNRALREQEPSTAKTPTPDWCRYERPVQPGGLYVQHTSMGGLYSKDTYTHLQKSSVFATGPCTNKSPQLQRHLHLIAQELYSCTKWRSNSILYKMTIELRHSTFIQRSIYTLRLFRIGLSIAKTPTPDCTRALFLQGCLCNVVWAIELCVCRAV